MTTRDFIKNNYGVHSTRERRCSSVFADHDGNIYSYGYHYPLLFQVNGIWFINRRGYSNTTSKHIGWAYSATDYTAIGVELSPSTVYRTDLVQCLTIDDILRDLSIERNGIVAVMQSKKRKDTGVYNGLVAQLTDVESRIDRASI